MSSEQAQLQTDRLSDRLDKADDRSIGELFSAVSQDLSTLMRQEVELAKAEVRQSAKNAGVGVGMLGGAGVGHMVLVFLSVAVWWGIANWTGHAWSALIVAVLWAAIGAVLYAVGRRRLTQVGGLPKTAETASDSPRHLPETRRHDEQHDQIRDDIEATRSSSATT